MKQNALDSALLRKAEVEVERLVAVLRIGVALCLLFAFLYAVQGEGAHAQPYLRVQWILALCTLVSYFLLGGLAFWLATSGRFRRWMVWLVPVILAFSVLRFNPYLQAYCVTLTVAGLAYLTLWEPEAITPHIADRVKDLVMLPPNVVRITMIALGGVVLIAAAYRTRKLLHSSIVDAQARANLTRYLPAQMADRLADGGLSELRRGKQHEMAVMFVDIRGFTNWSEGRAPEEVGAYISEFRRRVHLAVGNHGGMIDKFIGDAAMILFEEENAACQALTCVEALLRELQDWGDARRALGRNPVRVGIGVHFGEVFSGVVGDAERLEYSVFGDTVNTAARLEELTKTAGAGVIASAAVLQAAAAEPAREGWTALPAVHLRGRSSGLEIFGRELVGPEEQ